MPEEKHYFTVKKLISILNDLPADLPVLVNGYKSGYENFYHPMVVSVKHEPENWFEDGEFQSAEEGEHGALEAVILERVLRDD